LSDLGGYGGLIPADSCEEIISGQWECRWVGLTTAKSHGSSAAVYLIKAFDDTGNAAAGLASAVVKVDKRDPIISSKEVSAFGEIETPAGLIASGDEVIITIEGTDDSGVRAFGDFSRIYDVTGAAELEAGCSVIDNEFTCAWDLSSVVSGYLSTTINIEVVDTAGNSQTTTIPIEILDKEVEPLPDYWVIAEDPVEIMPEKLDRQTVPLINQRVYAKIELSSGAGAELAEAKFVGCAGDTGYIESADFFNNQRGSVEPYLMLELKTSDVDDVENLNLSCSLEIMSIYNRKLSNIEVEEFAVEIPFFNFPIGEASDEIEKDIDDIKDKYIDGWMGWIGSLTTLLEYAEAICNLLYTWRKLVTVWQSITTAVGQAKKAATGTYAYAALKAAEETFCHGTEGLKTTVDYPKTGIMSFADKFCGIINCKYVPEDPPKEGLDGAWSFIGGGQTWVDKYSGLLEKSLTVEDFTGNKWDGSDEYNRFVSPGNTNKKDSLILSLVGHCLPGIIYNLNKWRQIQCMYVICLEDSIETGASVTACTEVKEQMECKYIYGEVHQILSWLIGFDYYINLIKEAFSNPFTIIGAILALSCVFWCEAGDAWHDTCIWIKITSELLDVIANISNIQETWEIQEDYCEEVD
jgi:hypothetical protein